MAAEEWVYFDNDLELRGEIYRPAAPNGAGVLVVHEADGIGSNVRAHCARLADAGYLTAAADMHGGGRVLEAAEMAAALNTFRSDLTLLRRRVRAAFDALCGRPEIDRTKLAAIGFCFGGTAVLELARSGAPIQAVASFHGLLTTSAPAVAAMVRARILVATGALDPLVSREDVAAFENEMAAAGADWHLLIHGRALHSYTNRAVGGLGDARMAYDPFAHDLSWATVTTFLNNALEISR